MSNETASKSANPAYPDAHPTAPGGMSRAALRVELAEKHGVPMTESASIKWPVLIDMVVQGRLDREREAGATRSTEADHKEPGEDTFDDLDDLLAEFAEPEASVDEACKCGTPESEHDSVDPPHSFVPQGGWDDERDHREIAPGEDAATYDSEEGEEVFDPETLFAEMAEEFSAEQAKNPPIFIGIPGIADYVFDGHAGAGPSASERWMNCTMSLSASRKFLETLSPNQQRAYAGANLAARQGTTAHAAAEAEANHMLGRITEEELQATLLELMIEPDTEAESYDDEMGEYITEYVDLFQGYANERGADNILIESRVEAAIPLAGLHEGEVYIIRGSLDGAALPTPEDPTLVVGDLKYGDGIWVEVTANTQALIYALALLGLLIDDEGNLIIDIETIRLHIIQPRLGGIKTWEISLDDLFDWRDDVLSPALTKALYPDEGATYEPSPGTCQFCPARGSCPALAQQRVEQAAELFDVIQDVQYEDPDALPDAALMDDATLGNLLTQITGLIGLHKEMRAEVERRLYRGHAIPGFDLRNYSPPRRWKDGAQDKIAAGEVKLTKRERDALFKEPVLLTPKQALTVLGEKGKSIEALIETPDKRPVVSTGPGDRRSVWTGKPPEAMFDDESTPADEAASAERMFPDD